MGYNKHITNLSDSDFLSFLYAEREREINIHSFHGWNNWVLIGAIITFVCSGYTILKDNPDLCKLNVLYYTISLVSLFLVYHYLEPIFSKDRKVDLSKVRMMKEVFPFERVTFILFFGITSSVFIAIFDRCNEIFWFLFFVIIAYTMVCIVCNLYKEKFIPSKYKEMTLPWKWANDVFVVLFSGVFSGMMTESFKVAGGTILSREFGLASCIAAVLILMYFLSKFNLGNNVVTRFDVIIDKYLYVGATKEDIFHEISMNRMGYDIIDTCCKELQAVEKQINLCVEGEKDLEEIQKVVLSGECSDTQMSEYLRKIDVILDNQQTALEMSQTLLRRMDEAAKVSSSFRSISEINRLFDANKQCLEKVKAVTIKAAEVSKLLGETEKNILAKVVTALEEDQNIDDKETRL